MIETDISFDIFGVPERKSPMDMTRKILEEPRTNHQARVFGTNIIISIALVNYEFLLGIKTE
jgi:hypothetical protein